MKKILLQKFKSIYRGPAHGMSTIKAKKILKIMDGFSFEYTEMNFLNDKVRAQIDHSHFLPLLFSGDLSYKMQSDPYHNIQLTIEDKIFSVSCDINALLHYFREHKFPLNIDSAVAIQIIYLFSKTKRNITTKFTQDKEIILQSIPGVYNLEYRGKSYFLLKINQDNYLGFSESTGMMMAGLHFWYDAIVYSSGRLIFTQKNLLGRGSYESFCHKNTRFITSVLHKTIEWFCLKLLPDLNPIEYDIIKITSNNILLQYLDKCDHILYQDMTNSYWKILALSCTQIATKYHFDDYFDNKSVCKLFDIDLFWLNTLEAELLFTCGFEMLNSQRHGQYQVKSTSRYPIQLLSKSLSKLYSINQQEIKLTGKTLSEVKPSKTNRALRT